MRSPNKKKRRRRKCARRASEHHHWKMKQQKETTATTHTHNDSNTSVTSFLLLLQTHKLTVIRQISCRKEGEKSNKKEKETKVNGELASGLAGCLCPVIDIVYTRYNQNSFAADAAAAKNHTH